MPGSNQLTDTDIALMVSKALESDVSVPNEHIQTKVEDGWVTLKGEVGWWQHQKSAADAALFDLSGVKGVSNEIDLKPLGCEEKVLNVA
jgi:osmotically-inducible protein OsmY